MTTENQQNNNSLNENSPSVETDKMEIDLDFNLDFKFAVSPQAKVLWQSIQQVGKQVITWVARVSLLLHLLNPSVESLHPVEPTPTNSTPLEQVQLQRDTNYP